jgi:hypothetical protein
MDHDAPNNLLRRAFLGKVTVTVGGVTLGGLLPVSLLQAAPAACLVDASRYADPCGDWQLDDVFTAYPPYSLHPASSLPRAQACGSGADPVDLHWLG